MRALSAALAILVAASPVAAKPKGGAAKVEFERGVAAYQKKDFAAARDAFTKSLALEPDVEAKYALMQTERLLGNCDATIAIAKELLEGETKAANKQALKDTIDQCKSSAPSKEPAVAAPAPGGPSSGSSVAPDPQGAGSAPPTEDRPPVVLEKRSPWWKDPYGDALVGAGVVGVGVGVGFLWSAQKATDKRDSFDGDKGDDPVQFKKYKDRGKLHGTIGLAAGITGVALVGGGIYRYMTRSGGAREERTAVTGWVTADGGGIAAIGRF